MTRHHTLAALAACTALAAGCGDDNTDDAAAPQPKAQSVSVAERHALLEKDPYALRCSDIDDTAASADMSRRVQYALADDAKVKGLNRLQSSQSIYYAITELCKGRPGAYEPAEDAIAAVRSGDLRADLGTP
jgi:hypothetical protein